MCNKVVFLLSCLMSSGCFVVVAAMAGDEGERRHDAQTQAEDWLEKQRLSVGWDWRKGRCATIGTSCFDCPGRLSDKEFFEKRDKAFFSAYAKMVQEQLGLLRKIKKSEENIQSGGLGRITSSTTIARVFGDIMRPWESDGPRFVWRIKSLSDDNGNDCEIDNRTLVVKSENRSALEGAVQGLESLQYFESWDRKGAIYEVAVVGIQTPARSLQNMQAFVKGGLPERQRGNMSFDEWLASRDAMSLVGARSIRDKDGQVWVVGAAPVFSHDISEAKRRARFWAAFALGTNIKSERLIVQCTDFTSFYGDRLSLDASESVCGESYPEGMIQYRRLPGRCVADGRKPADVVACILRSGTRDFQAVKFQKNVQRQVVDDFVAGRKKSLHGLREAIMRRMDELTGPENAHRRKGLAEALEKLDRELKNLELEGDAKDDVSPYSP